MSGALAYVVMLGGAYAVAIALMFALRTIKLI